MFSVTYELFSIIFMNVNLTKMILLYASLPLQRECELLTSDLIGHLSKSDIRNLIAVRHSGHLWDYIPDTFSS